MTVSPFEVERREFGRTAMGYKPREVDSFLDEVHRTLTQLWQERGDVREENERIRERLSRYEQQEEQLKNTLLLAQDSAEKVHAQARREADLILREAGQKARDIVNTSHEERQRLEMVLRDLHSAEQEARQRMRALSQTVLSHLDDTELLVSDGAATLRAIVTAQPEVTELATGSTGTMDRVSSQRGDDVAADDVDAPQQDDRVRRASRRSAEDHGIVTPRRDDDETALHADAELRVQRALGDHAAPGGATDLFVSNVAPAGEVADAFFGDLPTFDMDDVAPPRATDETGSFDSVR